VDYAGIFRPVIGVSELTRFIRYIYYWNLQILNNVIIIKTKLLSHHPMMTLADFGYSVDDPLFTCSQRLLSYLAFLFFDF
jgi:hypothetical protein